MRDADGVLDSMVTNIFGVYPKWKINGNINRYPFLEVIVRDGCGNVASASLPFEVVDCKGAFARVYPMDWSLPDIAAQCTDVDNDGDIDLGAHTVYAVDFVASPYPTARYDDLFDQSVGEIPSPDQNAIILTCDDLGILIVEIHAWDLADNPYALTLPTSMSERNHDFCETFISGPGQWRNCVISQGIVASLVQREDDQPVEAVEVELSGDDAAAVLTADDSTMYAFNGLELDYDYTITPYRDGDDHNGLSTFDIVLISQHILGTPPGFPLIRSSLPTSTARAQSVPLTSYSCGSSF